MVVLVTIRVGLGLAPLPRQHRCHAHLRGWLGTQSGLDRVGITVLVSSASGGTVFHTWEVISTVLRVAWAHLLECKQAHRSVEDVHPFTCCVALMVMSPTPRVVQWKRTALMFAIRNKNDAMVSTLLDHNANPDIQDRVRQGPQ